MTLTTGNGILQLFLMKIIYQVWFEFVLLEDNLCGFELCISLRVYYETFVFFCRSYNTALVSICDSGLFGLIIMLLSSALSGLLFTILVWCNSHTWIYFKHKGRYIKVNTRDYVEFKTLQNISNQGKMKQQGIAYVPTSQIRLLNIGMLY